MSTTVRPFHPLQWKIAVFPRLFMVLLLCVAGRAFGLSVEAMQSMVIVEGDEGRGSAFVVKMDGKTYLITNSHVVRGNKNLKFKNLSNKELMVGQLEIADHADLVRAEVLGTAPSLAIAEKVEQNLQIGSEILVTGNSEGEGVVREISGKVVGVGPDRIEVDAEFVPGNSGSPILLKSTGQVIGVATYMMIPRSLRGSTKSVMSLNQVRRFGYRLDTVTKWISPHPVDRIMREGMKLSELEQTMAVVVSILNAGTASLTRYGSNAFISKERIAVNPGLASLAATLDEFAAASQTAKDPADGKKNVLKLFDALKTATVEDIRGYKEEHFSGYFAVQFKEQLEQRKTLYEWLDKTVLAAAKNPQILSGPAAGGGAPPVDVTKLNFLLKDEIYMTTAQQKEHRVTYPLESKPANLENIFWVEELPSKETRVIQMHSNNLRMNLGTGGIYRVHVEYRTAGMIRRVSNEVELDLPEASAARDPVITATPEINGPPAATGFMNTMGMKFTAVPGTGIFMCIHDTRRKDYAAYAAETPGLDETWKHAKKFGVPVGDGDDHPVVSVSWEEAVAFCEWLSKKEGRIYRLPTDQEWSYAAGIGARESKGIEPQKLAEKIAGEYPWGTEWPPPKSAGNFADTSHKEKFPSEECVEGYTDGYATTAPVMSFTPNKLGIYDLAGNVWQWCGDWFNAEHKQRVTRGGSWDDHISANFLSSRRAHTEPNARRSFTGFRCVAVDAPKPQAG